MLVKKKTDTYNTYTLEISYGQLEAFRAALEADHTDSTRDETLAELAWYMDHVPGPGEEEEDTEAKEKGDLIGDEDESPLPMPPSGESGLEGESEELPAYRPAKQPERGLPEPGMDGEDEEGLPEAPPAEGAGEAEPAPPEEEAEERLPKPPRE